MACEPQESHRTNRGLALTLARSQTLLGCEIRHTAQRKRTPSDLGVTNYNSHGKVVGADKLHSHLSGVLQIDLKSAMRY